MQKRLVSLDAFGSFTVFWILAGVMAGSRMKSGNEPKNKLKGLALESLLLIFYGLISMNFIDDFKKGKTIIVARIATSVQWLLYYFLYRYKLFVKI